MADDTSTQRSLRSNDPYSRGATSTEADPAANDPLAELARLIGQTDPFAEFGRDTPRRAPAAAQHRDTAPQPAHQMDAQHADASQQSHPGYDGRGHDGSYNPGDGAAPYDEDQMQPPDEDYYVQDSSPQRRLGIIAIAGVFALGVIGTAGAFGYRALFGPGGSPLPPPVIKADTTPSKIVPQSGDQKSGGKVIYDRVGDRGHDEKVVSREETPLDIKNKPTGVIPPPTEANGSAGGALQAMAGDSNFTEPKKIHTIVIRPDQPDMGLPAPAAPDSAATSAPPTPAPQRAVSPRASRVADAQPQQPALEAAPRHVSPPPHGAEPAVHHTQAAPRNAPLSLSPGGNANPPAAAKQPMRVANAPAASAAPPPRSAASSAAHGEYVQVSSQRSEADAQASFRTLQGKYPKQLGSRQPVIHRADLGAKGVYYRALVGPFANAGEAAQLCSSLKAAGGSCLIQRN